MLVNSNLNIGFKSTIKQPVIQQEDIPDLDQRYTTPESRAKTFAIMGNSRTSQDIIPQMGEMFRATKTLTQNGYNIATGCGDGGIMGAAYRGANAGIKAAQKQGKQPGENLALVRTPLWGDEDLAHCRPVGKFLSEAQRVEDGFFKVADHVIVGSPGATTLGEASIAIASNKYSKDKKDVCLVGRQYGDFDGLNQQYEQMAQKGRIGQVKLADGTKRNMTPTDLYTYTDLDDVIKRFPPIN